MRSSLTVCAALALSVSAASAEGCPTAKDEIATDRPDVANSSLVVPAGSLQVENGINASSQGTAHGYDGTNTRLRLGIAPKIMKVAASTVRKLRTPATEKDAVTLKITDDLAELLNGKLDVLLRSSVGSHPGLHVDRLVLAGTEGTRTPAVLLTHPGLAGCREHSRLLRRLTELA